jgi:hypothetical protein
VAFSLKFLNSGKIHNSAFYGTEIHNFTPQFRGKIFILCDNIRVYPTHHLHSKPVLGSFCTCYLYERTAGRSTRLNSLRNCLWTTKINMQKFCVKPTICLCFKRISEKKRLFCIQHYLIFFIAESVYASCAVKSRSSDLTDAVSSLKWLMYQIFHVFDAVHIVWLLGMSL